jgi:hypothetical protein
MQRCVNWEGELHFVWINQSGFCNDGRRYWYSILRIDAQFMAFSTIKPHLDWANQSTIRIGLKYSGSLNKSKTPHHFRFPRANPHKVPISHIVPESNPLNQLILLCICSDNPQPIRLFSQ